MEWASARKELIGTIMNTDIVCEILHTDFDQSRAFSYIERAVEMFRNFEKRYSRFRVNNELWHLNTSERTVVSEELFDLLEQSKRYHELTGGIFDPSVLPVMESSGYVGAYGEYSLIKKGDFSQLILDRSTRTVVKPHNLMVDLGGIGKGFIVDKVAGFLGGYFEHFLVYAGGDIAVRGVNKKEDYAYWAIDIEHPKVSGESAALLLLKDVSVATSGRNRKHWLNQGQKKHHLIDPSTQESASYGLLSVSVVAASTAEADVFAKTLFIAGKEKGMAMAEKLKIPAVFIDAHGVVTCNHYIETYVWKP